MNSVMIRKLIAKDIYLYRMLAIKYLLGGLAVGSVFYLIGASGLMRLSARGMFLVAQQVTVVAFGVHLLIVSVLKERMQGGTPFSFGLPISFIDYVTAKTAASLLLFLMVWLILPVSIGITGIMLGFDFVTILFVSSLHALLVLGFCAALMMAVITNSLGWLMITIAIVADLYLKSLTYVELLEAYSGSFILIIELITVSLLVACTILSQRGKADLV
ncbi:hypothetical protein [Kordiimonas sp. SCSIO 12610]|uniref:hypothetical protein n=1 Tax=Kordiimonas sp. SCSIO 12610 TaxID=2829597 RepID=UPI00210B8885|nr:hypothetical protein [Kordiimonas sp. SCSIO 12610]UTW56114.1 hypothetical protein KFF44_04255 [Kordiimonas sp. SCSIO 12610]